MDVSKLTDYQLYGLSQNKKFDAGIRQLANKELNSRQLAEDRIQQIILKHDAQFKPGNDESLSLPYKISLILFPFFLQIQILFTSKYLANNQVKKWKAYWFYLSLGWLLWTIVTILIAKLVA
jgi:hypothetical protein